MPSPSAAVCWPRWIASRSAALFFLLDVAGKMYISSTPTWKRPEEGARDAVKKPSRRSPTGASCVVGFRRFVCGVLVVMGRAIVVEGGRADTPSRDCTHVNTGTRPPALCGGARTAHSWVNLRLGRRATSPLKRPQSHKP